VKRIFDYILRSDPASEAMSDTTHFLNVDLELYSKSDLQPLVTFMSKRVSVLYVGRERRMYCAKVELGKYTKDADSTIRGLCALIRSLPAPYREMWDAAKVRDFSIGVEAGTKTSVHDIVIEQETVKAVSELNARIIFTVYASMRTNEL